MNRWAVWGSDTTTTTHIRFGPSDFRRDLIYNTSPEISATALGRLCVLQQHLAHSTPSVPETHHIKIKNGRHSKMGL